MLNSIFSNNNLSIGIEKIILCLVVAIILGIVISLTHKKTTKYSKNFIETLAVLPVIVCVIIIMVNGNLGTGVAVAGAFSLVRFRSIPGTSKEIMSVFLAMATGLSIGMGHIFFSIITTIIICLFILTLNSINKNVKNIKNLTIIIPENLNYTHLFDDVLNKYTNNYQLNKVKTTNMGSLFELSYLIELKKDIDEKSLIDEIRIMNGNLKITMNDLLIEGEL